MTTLRRLPAALGLAVALCCAAPVVPGRAEALQPTAPAASLELVTMPPMPEARFLLDGTPLVTDDRGVARGVFVPGDGPRSLALANPVIESPLQIAEFVRWWGRGVRDEGFSPTMSDLRLRRDVRIQVGFRVSYEVIIGFTDQAREPIDPARVSAVTLRSDAGQIQARYGPGSLTLVALRPVVDQSRLIMKPATYTVAGIEIDGSNAVTGGEQRFTPEYGRPVTLVVPLRSLRFRAYDLIFGGPLGSAVELTFPDGRRMSLPLDDTGHALAPELVRGSYRVQLVGPGYTPTRPVEVSRSQTVALPVLTYLDMGVLGAAVLVAVGGLVLARRHRRRSLLGEADVEP